MALTVLADKMDGTGYCWPGVELIAKQAGLSRRTVIRALAQAVDLGELMILPRPGRSNAYVMTLGAEPSTILEALTERARMSKKEAQSLLDEHLARGVNLSPLSDCHPCQIDTPGVSDCHPTPVKLTPDPKGTQKNPDDDQGTTPDKSSQYQPPAAPEWISRLHQTVFMTVGTTDAALIRKLPAKYPKSWIEEAYTRAKAQIEQGKRIMSPGSYLTAILDGMYQTGLTGDNPNDTAHSNGLAANRQTRGKRAGRHQGQNGRTGNQAGLGEPAQWASPEQQQQFEAEFAEWQF
jgi:hypothetical protein